MSPNCVCCHFAFHEKYSENGIFIFWIGKTLLAFNSDCGCYISLFSCILKNGILYPHLLGDNGRSFKLFLDADLRKLSVHLCFSSIWKKTTTSVSHSIACILYNTASARWSHDPLPETAAWPCLLLQATVMCMGLFAVRWSMTYSGVKKANKETTEKTKNNISATFFFFFSVFSSQWQWLATLLMPVILQVPLPCSTCASSNSLGAMHSQCHCICSSRHCQFIICWLLNHYWAAYLHIVAYKVHIY